MGVRIGRFLSHIGLCSRREAANFVKERNVFFSGEKITDLNFTIKTEDLSKPLIVDNREYFWEDHKTVVLLHKPKGYISSHSRYKNVPSVMSLLPAEKSKFFFAGRLDKNSTGLMVFANDGDLIHRLTHPSYRVRKVYMVHVQPPLDNLSIQKCLKGIYDGKERLFFDKIKKTPEAGHYKIILHRGKNREIRRVMKRLKRTVLALQRIQLGIFKLGDLKEGHFRIWEARKARPDQR